MNESVKVQPLEAAKQLIHEQFSNCQGALLAGSVVRGEATETSDLDIVIFDNSIRSSYRESLVYLGLNIEVFVHNLASYQEFFQEDYEQARPSMPRMVVEGLILKDEGILKVIKKEASEIMMKGPEKWSRETIEVKRYFITDALDDFIGCTKREEAIFIANSLAELVSEFVLRTNQQWIGTSKWLFRSLRYYDNDFAERFVRAFDTFYKTDEKSEIIQLVDNILLPYGGRLFAGFSLGKMED